MSKRKRNKDKSSRELTWAVLIKVMYKKEEGKDSELVHVEVDEWIEPLAQAKAIGVIRAHFPDAQGFQILHTTALDNVGRPISPMFNHFKPTKMVVDDEVAELKGGYTEVKALPNPDTASKPAAAYVSRYPSNDLPNLFTEEALATLCDVDGVITYDAYNRHVVGGN